jgi:hypothetical protein
MVLEPCCHAAVCRQSRAAHGSRPSSRSCMARSVRHDEAVKDKMSAVVENSPQHSSLHPRDCSSDVLYRDTGYYSVLIDAAKLDCRCQEHGGWPMAQGHCDSHSGVAVVSARPKVGTDWCGNVKSIAEQIQHRILPKSDCMQRVQPALWGSVTP